MLQRSKVLRTFLGAALLFGLQELHAQATAYTAIVQEVETGSSPKALFSAVVELLPDAEMTHDASTGTFTMITALPITHEILEQVTIPAGYYLISLEQDL